MLWCDLTHSLLSITILCYLSHLPYLGWDITGFKRPCAYICFLNPVISRLACLRDIFSRGCHGNGVYDIITTCTVFGTTLCTYFHKALWYSLCCVTDYVARLLTFFGFPFNLLLKGELKMYRSLLVSGKTANMSMKVPHWQAQHEYNYKSYNNNENKPSVETCQ